MNSVGSPRREFKFKAKYVHFLILINQSIDVIHPFIRPCTGLTIHPPISQTTFQMRVCLIFVGCGSKKVADLNVRDT